MFASFTPAVGSMTTFLLKIMEPSYAFFETQKYVEILNNIWIKFYIGILAIFGNFKSNFRLIDDIAKGSDNSTNKKLNTEVRKCESVVVGHLFLRHLKGILWPSWKRTEANNLNLKLKYLPKKKWMWGTKRPYRSPY